MSEDSWHWIFLSPSCLVFGSVDSSPPSPLAHLQSRKARQFWFHLDHNHLILVFPSPETTHWTHPWIWMFPKIRAPRIASSVGESDSSRHPPKSNRRKNKWNGESMSVPQINPKIIIVQWHSKCLFNLMPGLVPIPSPRLVILVVSLNWQCLRRRAQETTSPMPHVVQRFTNLSWWTRRSWRMTRRLIGTSVGFNLACWSWLGGTILEGILGFCVHKKNEWNKLPKRILENRM